VIVTKEKAGTLEKLRQLRLGLFLTVLGAAAMCSGCSGKEGDESYRVVRKASKKKRSKATNAQATSDAKAEKPVVFSYSPIGKRDPFKSYISVLVKNPGENKNKAISPTEEYELDQYKLTGLLSGTSQPRALVSDPKGAGHVIKIGTRLGRNGGRVTRISNNTVEVIEEFRAPTGERIRVPITIELPREEITLKARP
jgi:type IV pilus assembly protein PilP